MAIGSINYFLNKLLKLETNSKIAKELNNYLVRNKYNSDYDKIASDLKKKVEPLVYLKNTASDAFIASFKEDNIYYSLVEGSFITDKQSPLLDYEIHKNTMIDEDGFDIIVSANKGQDLAYEANLSCHNNFISGYITTSNMERVTLHFIALNELIDEIEKENLLLTFSMRELEKHLVNYIKANTINDDIDNVRSI